MRTDLEQIAVIAKMADILDVIASGTSVNVTEISRAVNLPRTTVYRILHTLVAADVVTPAYQPGSRLIRWASQALQHTGFSDIVIPILQDLVGQFRQTTSVYIRTGAARICVHRMEGLEPLRHYVPIGVPFPLHVGSAGRVLLAWLPAEQRAGLLAESRRWSGLSALSDQPDWQQIVAVGWAATLGERDPALASISVPIFDASNQVMAALSISGPKERFNDEQIHTMAIALVARASSMHARLEQLPEFWESPHDVQP